MKNHSFRAQIEKTVNQAEREVKKLILEELASINPFPRMKIGVYEKEVPGFKQTKDGEGILIRDSLTAGCGLPFAEAIVLKQDGAYIYTGFGCPINLPKMWELVPANFLPMTDSKIRKFYDHEYFRNYNQITLAIEKAKK